MREFFSKNFTSSRIFRYSNFIIFGTLLFISFFLVANSWNVISYRGIPAWCMVLPIVLFLTFENAIKLWALEGHPEKYACYVVDLVCLMILTVFANGALITVLYVVILTEFYLGEKNLIGCIIMAAAAIGSVLTTYIALNFIRGIETDVIALISSLLNDILLIVFHFFVLNFAIQMYRKNDEITKALDELNASNRKLRAAYRELQEITALEERQRIAKDIHDTAGHSITTVIMQTEAARLVIDSDPEDAKLKLSAANMQAKHALEELRESVHLLSGMRQGQTLKDLLLEIIHDSTDGTNITIRYDIDDITVSDTKRRFIRNTLKEGISNGLRHGGATAFWFELKEKDRKISFLLSDNGAGQDMATLKEGFGLAGMHTRAASLGGQVRFETEPGEGFEIHLILPSDGNRG